eukprot:771222-Amphidinium_carterae.1
MADNTTLALGMLKPSRTWVVASATSRHPQLWSAVQCCARRYHVHAVACRLGAGVRNLPRKKEFAASIGEATSRGQLCFRDECSRKSGWPPPMGYCRARPSDTQHV